MNPTVIVSVMCMGENKPRKISISRWRVSILCWGLALGWGGSSGRKQLVVGPVSKRERFAVCSWQNQFAVGSLQLAGFRSECWLIPRLNLSEISLTESLQQFSTILNHIQHLNPKLYATLKRIKRTSFIRHHFPNAQIRNIAVGSWQGFVLNVG